MNKNSATNAQSGHPGDAQSASDAQGTLDFSLDEESFAASYTNSGSLDFPVEVANKVKLLTPVNQKSDRTAPCLLFRVLRGPFPGVRPAKSVRMWTTRNSEAPQSQQESEQARSDSGMGEVLDGSVPFEEAEAEEEAEEQLEEQQAIQSDEMQPITDKFFYKEMAKIKEKSKTQRSGILPPKKSASAYIIFQKEKRPEILKQTPKAKVTEVVREIARCWSLMTKEDRMVYKLEAKRDKERYEKELKTLESQSSTIKKPKKCLSAYMIFVKETRPKIVAANIDMGALEVMQEVGRAWQSMVEDDRKYFKDKADKDKNRYLIESRTFYDEVARIGEKNHNQEQNKLALQKKTAKVPDLSNSMACTPSDPQVGKKRPPQQTAKKVLQRSSSMTGKRAANSVMAIGLAPDTSPQTSAQKRMRAESKFTFKPENHSENEYSRDNDFEEDDASVDSEDDGEGQTAKKFFAKEFKEVLTKDFQQVKASTIRQAVKKRWLELTLKQKSPFEQLAHQESLKNEEKKRPPQGTTKAAGRQPRSTKVQQATPGDISQLSRTNQRLAKEALTVPATIANELQASLEEPGNNHNFNSDLNQENDQIDDNNQKGGANGGPHFDIDIADKCQLDDYFGMNRAMSGMQSNMNRINASMTPQSATNNQNQFKQQNQQMQNAQLLLQLQNQYLNPMNMNMLQNTSQQTHPSTSPLFGYQSSGDDFGGNGLNNNGGIGGANNFNGFSNDQLQHQLFQQLSNNSQQQQQQNQQLMLLLAAQAQAQQNPLNLNLNLLNQQAAFQLQQQLQQPLQNQNNLMALTKMAALNNNQFNQIDFSSLNGGNQLLQKNFETPQFAGLGNEFGDDFNTQMPAATQPIQNMFYQTTQPLEDQINFNNVFNASHGLNPALATPNTTAALGNLQNHNLFELPASAQHTAAFQSESAATPNQMFGTEHKNPHNYSQNNQTGQLNPSCPNSPLIPPTHNDHSQQEHSQHLWQQNNAFSKTNSLNQKSSSNNLLSGLNNSASAQKGSFISNNQSSGAQQTPSNYLTSIKDQQTVSASASNQNLLTSMQNGNGAGSNSSLLNNPQEHSGVTPFLKPSERSTTIHRMQQPLSSPFLQGSAQQPPSNAYANLNFGQMLGPQQSSVQQQPPHSLISSNSTNGLLNQQSFPQQQQSQGNQAQSQALLGQPSLPPSSSVAAVQSSQLPLPQQNTTSTLQPPFQTSTQPASSFYSAATASVAAALAPAVVNANGGNSGTHNNTNSIGANGNGNAQGTANNNGSYQTS